MSSIINVKRISGGTTFKLLFIGFVVFHILSTLMVMALTVMGVLPYGTDIAETQAAPLIVIVAGYLVFGVITSPLWVGIFWLSVWPGLWIYSLIRPMDLRYVRTDASNH